MKPEEIPAFLYTKTSLHANGSCDALALTMSTGKDHVVFSLLSNKEDSEEDSHDQKGQMFSKRAALAWLRAAVVILEQDSAGELE